MWEMDYDKAAEYWMEKDEGYRQSVFARQESYNGLEKRGEIVTRSLNC